MRLQLLVLAAGLTLQACAQMPIIGSPKVAAPAPERSALLLDALGYIGTPYVFGGNTGASGLDCSGYVKAVFEQAEGIALPRTALEQSRATPGCAGAHREHEQQLLEPALQWRAARTGRGPQCEPGQRNALTKRDTPSSILSKPAVAKLMRKVAWSG